MQVFPEAFIATGSHFHQMKSGDFQPCTFLRVSALHHKLKWNLYLFMKTPSMAPILASKFLVEMETGGIKHSKHFFHAKIPWKQHLQKKNHPNFKINSFLAHVQSVLIEAWELGRNISVDEQTNGFKGNHVDKQQINYKREGDGFLADTLCQSGYTYTFYLWNMPPPKHYSEKGCSALHARVLFMFDQLTFITLLSFAEMLS